MVGTWSATEQSLKEVSEEKPASETITSFTLKADLTSTIHYKDDKKAEGTWEWKDSKVVSKGIFSAYVSSTVFIYTHNQGWGMMPKRTDDEKITLTVADYLFEKQ